MNILIKSTIRKVYRPFRRS